MCVNSDTESVLYRNIDLFDSFEAYAPDGVLSVGAFLVPVQRVLRKSVLPNRLTASTVRVLMI